ncbi:TPA: hypothetical protein ACG3NF_002750 [Legionella pneumophila]|uniref:Uncharacterized protein n=1 Tax=Legionella pneumophila TaxID=446 RepID=A0A378K7K8_LEGPN|nr:hypothetical protein [Legionella pneumophila]MCZ4682008.1 hypothetical protein [Legionella pneumophila]MCZ4689331.1 hypothetical protein [Legionella pneumophila]MCZ4708112.1 hypothetical protein [Legionella pneumophila]MCZ4717282.1 hypothetical protein [Legionella pneumophila]MCZ4738624.1 hypothetical protein [Legionella pneumophila]
MKKFLDAKWLGLIALNILLVVFVCVKHPSSSSNNNLNGLEKKLTTIESRLNKPTQQPDLTPITDHIKQLGDFIQQMQNKDDHQLGDLFSTEQAAIKSQLDGIQELLKHLDSQKQPVKMLPASALPFKVLSIDSIQEVSVASVAYDYKTRALEKGDSLVGWKVLDINFAKQTIEFENAEKAHVLIHLTQQEVSNE